jgi:probable HAF family extracellular repeat protein
LPQRPQCTDRQLEAATTATATMTAARRAGAWRASRSPRVGSCGRRRGRGSDEDRASHRSAQADCGHFVLALAGLAFGVVAGSAPYFRAVDLGTLGGYYSGAVDVSDAGQVVGHSCTAGWDERAFMWTKTGGMVDLRDLGGDWSYPSR